METIEPIPNAPAVVVPGVESNPSTPQHAAARSVTPDAVTADILRRHAAGQKLTPSEGGKLGAFKRKLKSALGVGSPERPEPNPFSASAVRIPVAHVAPPEASHGGLPLVPVDAGFARRTAIVTLNKLDGVAAAWITREARAANITGNDLSNLTSKASLANDDKQLIGDLAPDICAELGIDPRKSPLIVAGAVLAAHGASLFMAVMEIREMKEKDAKREREREDRARAAVVTARAAETPGTSPAAN